jgi:DNA-binding protein HU-beta
MTKQDLIDVMADAADISKAAAHRALEAFTDTVIDQLSQGNDVPLTGFGSFTTSHRAARKGRNPQTGAEIDIAASVVARFKPGKKLKDAVNKNP